MLGPWILPGASARNAATPAVVVKVPRRACACPMPFTLVKGFRPGRGSVCGRRLTIPLQGGKPRNVSGPAGEPPCPRYCCRWPSDLEAQSSDRAGFKQILQEFHKNRERFFGPASIYQWRYLDGSAVSTVRPLAGAHEGGGSMPTKRRHQENASRVYEHA